MIKKIIIFFWTNFCVLICTWQVVAYCPWTVLLNALLCFKDMLFGANYYYLMIAIGALILCIYDRVIMSWLICNCINNQYNNQKSWIYITYEFVFFKFVKLLFAHWKSAYSKALFHSINDRLHISLWIIMRLCVYIYCAMRLW